MKLSVSFVIFGFLFFLQFSPALSNAVHSEKDTDDESPKIGLALSGGGAKGFVHIGVLNVLEEVGLPIDYISGTSIGALIGGLYAVGYTTDQITQLAIDLDWDDLFSDTIRRRSIPMEEKEYDDLYMVTLPILNGSISLPSGVVAGQRISLLLNDLLWQYQGHQDFSTFPIPFSCVATDIETGELVLLKDGHITDAIRSSISIPSAIMPHKINGRLLVDGGVVRNLPVEEAFELGSDYVIAVDVVAPLKTAEELNNIIDILDQTVTFQIKESVSKSRAIANMIIESDSAKTYSVADFDKVAELIALGEEAARKHYDELKSLADYINKLRGTEPVRPKLKDREDDIYITQIEVAGNKSISKQQIINRLFLTENSYVTRQQIKEGIESVYGMLFFDSILFRFLDSDDDELEGYKLFIEVNEKVENQFRFGFNYNNTDNASLLLNTTLRNFVQASSTLRLSLKLSEEPYFDANYFRHLNLEQNLAMNLKVNYSQNQIDLFSGSGERIAQYATNSLLFEGMLIPLTNNQLMGGVGIRQEFFLNTSRVGEVDIPGGTSNYTQFFAMLNQDNLERLHFPKRGHQVQFEASQSINFLNNALNFFKAEVEWNGYFQVNEQLTLMTSTFAGIATRSELPLHKQFYLGGYPDLIGFRKYELGSNTMRKFMLGARYEFFKNNFLEYRMNAASVADLNRFNFNDDPLRLGFSFGYGLNTLLGPIRANISTSQRNPVMISISLGAEF